MESNKAIWDCIDNLGKQPADVPIKHLIEMQKTVAEIRKTVDSLLTSCQAWEQKARLNERAFQAWEQKARLYERALEVACEDFEAHYDMTADDTCPMRFLDEETAAHCQDDNNCDTCLKQQFLKRAQSDIDCVENNKIVREEMEGRKRMDAEDTKQAGIDELARMNEGR